MHNAVEVAALNRDPVLSAFELGLQTLEILVGAQLRISLDHDEQPRERVAQLPLRRLEFLQLRGIAGRFVWIELHAADAGPRVGHFHER